MLKLPKIGDRVCLRADVGDYPISPIPSGSTGCVTTVAIDENEPYIGITFDAQFPDLNEWNNEFQLRGDDLDDPTESELIFTFHRLVINLSENARVAAKLAALCDEYEAWNAANGLNLGSADEHLFDESLTPAQLAWVRDFSRRWELVENDEA